MVGYGEASGSEVDRTGRNPHPGQENVGLHTRDWEVGSQTLIPEIGGYRSLVDTGESDSRPREKGVSVLQSRRTKNIPDQGRRVSEAETEPHLRGRRARTDSEEEGVRPRREGLRGGTQVIHRPEWTQVVPPRLVHLVPRVGRKCLSFPSPSSSTPSPYPL